MTDWLASGEPLFLIEADQPNGAATQPAGMDDCGPYDPNAIRLGVLKYGYGDSGIFALRSQKADASLRIGALSQFRLITGYWEEPDGDGDEEIESGFELSRLKAYAHGRIGSPRLSYRFQADLSTQGNGDFDLQDAWVKWRANDNWGVRLGQFKQPLHQEFLVHSGYQLAVERSLALEFLGGNSRVQGVSGMFSPSNRIRAELAVHDGFGSANSPYINDTTDIGVSGRVEALLGGRWRDYRDFTAAGTEENLFAVGGGVGYTFDGDDRFGQLTLDLQWENPAGFSAFGAVYANPSEFAGEDTFHVGGTAQIGYAYRNCFEPFGRVSILSLDDDVLPADAEDTYYEVSVGANWYPIKERGRHRAKVTADVNVLPDGIPADFPLLGYQQTDETEVVARVQFQLML